MDVQDTISLLPDDVLGQILSFLSTKQAASTSILSKRWRNVFVLVSSLEFDYFESVHKDRLLHRGPNYAGNFSKLVENLLNLQGNAPIKKFTLIGHNSVDQLYVQSWICNVLARGALDLDLDIITFQDEKYPPPLMIKGKTLVKLRLGSGIRIKVSPDDYLPMLKSLCLDNGFETLLSRCPVLEDLVVNEHRSIYGTVCVSSPSLKRLRVRIYHSSSPGIWLNVPNLVYFDYTCAACACCDPEKCQCILSGLSSSRVKLLEISSYRGTKRDLNQIKHFLRNLPCLEIVKISTSEDIQLPVDMQLLSNLPRASSNCKFEVIPSI